MRGCDMFATVGLSSSFAVQCKTNMDWGVRAPRTTPGSHREHKEDMPPTRAGMGHALEMIRTAVGKTQVLRKGGGG